MSTLKLVDLFEEVGEDSDKSLETQSEGSNSTQDNLKDFHDSDNHGSHFMDDPDKAYIILLNVFSHLSFYNDLLSAAGVCKIWNLVASDRIFWKRVSLKNCIVHDSNDCNMIVQTLKRNGVEILDLKPLVFYDREIYWPIFCRALNEVTTLKEVIMQQLYSKDVTLLAEGSSQLNSLSVYCFYDFLCRGQCDITFLKKMKDLKTLKLENTMPTELIFDRTDKIELNLTKLTVTRAINLSCIEHILPTTLVSLELGDSDSLSLNFCKVALPKLVNLTRLRLERCVKTELAMMLLQSISTLPNLSELELFDFIISAGFHKLIGKCTNLKRLLIVVLPNDRIHHLLPLTYSEILKGITRLKKSLQLFAWVITDSTGPIEDGPRMPLNKNLSNVKEMGCYNKIQVLIHLWGGVRQLRFVLCAKILSKFQSYFKFKIFTAFYSTAWKISLHNLKM